MRRILFAASEVSPFSKTGGLSDVAGSLPKEVVSKTNNIRVISPLYRGIEEKYGSELKYMGNFDSLVGWREQYTGIFSMKHNGVIHYFIDNKFYFDRENLYGYDDDNERFAFFCKAILEATKFLKFKPDVIHCNDWQTAAIPVMLKDLTSYDEFFQSISTILTIHNLKFQGLTDKFAIGDLFNLPDEYYKDDLLKFYEDVNILKGGIVCADKVTTVSPSYAGEIEYKYFGEKLHGVIHEYNYKLKGILNGLDYDLYNPETDEFIPNNFSVENVKNKKLNKEELQKSFGLPLLMKKIGKN